MVRPISFFMLGAVCSLTYMLASSAVAGDNTTQYYNALAPQAGGKTVVETTTYYEPAPGMLTTTTTRQEANPVVVVERHVPRGSQFNRDRYYIITRNYDRDHSTIDREPGDNTAGENDPRSQRNRLQYDSCPPGQAKRGFC